MNIISAPRDNLGYILFCMFERVLKLVYIINQKTKSQTYLIDFERKKHEIGRSQAAAYELIYITSLYA